MRPTTESVREKFFHRDVYERVTSFFFLCIQVMTENICCRTRSSTTSPQVYLFHPIEQSTLLCLSLVTTQMTILGLPIFLKIISLNVFFLFDLSQSVFLTSHIMKLSNQILGLLCLLVNWMHTYAKPTPNLPLDKLEELNTSILELQFRASSAWKTMVSTISR